MYVETRQTIIKPFCNSVTVIESPVEETVLASGIELPHNYEGKTDIKRGVIVSKGDCHCETWEHLENGTVIYYRGGVQIADVYIVDHDQIIAYEGNS
jgi:hypothetical protein